MPIISLRESLGRIKDKWKTKFGTGVNNDDSASSSIQGISGVQRITSPYQPFQSTADPPSLPQVTHDPTPPSLEVNDPPGKCSMAWSGIKTLLAGLESSADAFGPLKSAIDGLNRCTSIYETASKGRKDYAELHDKLNGLLSDLADHGDGQTQLEVTNAVNRLCSGIEAELRLVVEKQAQSRVKQLASAMETSDEIYGCYRRIQGHLEHLTLNANMKILKDINNLKTESRLTALSPGMAAAYNSSASDKVGRGKCTLGTREPQIEMLLEWACNTEAGRTCWMNGMAGTGKTTIAYTFCAKLDQAFELSASFFCPRMIPECRQVYLIIPSIAYQLARFSFPFRCALVKTLGADPNAHS